MWFQSHGRSSQGTMEPITIIFSADILPATNRRRRRTTHEPMLIFRPLFISYTDILFIILLAPVANSLDLSQAATRQFRSNMSSRDDGCGILYDHQSPLALTKTSCRVADICVATSSSAGNQGGFRSSLHGTPISESVRLSPLNVGCLQKTSHPLHDTFAFPIFTEYHSTNSQHSKLTPVQSTVMADHS